eukprot:1109361-Rhodomonas_salina.1
MALRASMGACVRRAYRGREEVFDDAVVAAHCDVAVRGDRDGKPLDLRQPDRPALSPPKSLASRVGQSVRERESERE